MLLAVPPAAAPLIHNNGINPEQIAAILACVAFAWAAVKAVAALFRKYVLRPNRDIAEARERESRQKEITDAVAVAVEPVTAQLHPNGGSSFRDAVDRQFREVFDHLSRQDNRIDAVYSSLHAQGAARTGGDE